MQGFEWAKIYLGAFWHKGALFLLKCSYSIITLFFCQFRLMTIPCIVLIYLSSAERCWEPTGWYSVNIWDFSIAKKNFFSQYRYIKQYWFNREKRGKCNLLHLCNFASLIFHYGNKILWFFFTLKKAWSVFQLFCVF